MALYSLMGIRAGIGVVGLDCWWRSIDSGRWDMLKNSAVVAGPGSADHSSEHQGVVGLQQGDHACFIYSTEQEHRMVVAAYLRDGLASGEKVIYFADLHRPEIIEDYLNGERIDASRYKASGQLIIIYAEQYFLDDDVFDPEKTMKLLKQEMRCALEQGYRGLRFTIEMTWALRGYPGSEKVIDFQAQLAPLLKAGKASTLSQFDARYCSSAVMLYALSTHPYALVRSKIYQNTWHMSLLPLQSSESARSVLSRWMTTLEQRGQC